MNKCVFTSDGELMAEYNLAELKRSLGCLPVTMKPRQKSHCHTLPHCYTLLHIVTKSPHLTRIHLFPKPDVSCRPWFPPLCWTCDPHGACPHFALLNSWTCDTWLSLCLTKCLFPDPLITLLLQDPQDTFLYLSTPGSLELWVPYSSVQMPATNYLHNCFLPIPTRPHKRDLKSHWAAVLWNPDFGRGICLASPLMYL